MSTIITRDLRFLSSKYSILNPIDIENKEPYPNVVDSR